MVMVNTEALRNSGLRFDILYRKVSVTMTTLAIADGFRLCIRIRMHRGR